MHSHNKYAFVDPIDNNFIQLLPFVRSENADEMASAHNCQERRQQILYKLHLLKLGKRVVN